MRSLEEETLYYAIAVLILFGGPFAAVWAWMKWADMKQEKERLAKADADYIATHGQAAYDDMKRKRAAAPPPSAVIGSSTEGIWHSAASPQKLIQLIELNLENALIGTPPYRLTQINSDLKKQQVNISGSWPSPTKIDPDTKQPTTTKLDLHLTLIMQADGRTSVTFKYTPNPPDDPFAKQAITLTTFWLKSLCETAR